MTPVSASASGSLPTAPAPNKGVKFNILKGFRLTERDKIIRLLGKCNEPGKPVEYVSSESQEHLRWFGEALSNVIETSSGKKLLYSIIDYINRNGLTHLDIAIINGTDAEFVTRFCPNHYVLNLTEKNFIADQGFTLEQYRTCVIFHYLSGIAEGFCIMDSLLTKSYEDAFRKELGVPVVSDCKLQYNLIFDKPMRMTRFMLCLYQSAFKIYQPECNAAQMTELCNICRPGLSSNNISAAFCPCLID